MPELPEVETTRRGLAPHLVNQRIRTAIVRNRGLASSGAARIAGARCGRHRCVPSTGAASICSSTAATERSSSISGCPAGCGSWTRPPRSTRTIISISCSRTAGRCGCAIPAASVSCCGRPATRCGIRCSRTSVPSPCRAPSAANGCTRRRATVRARSSSCSWTATWSRASATSMRAKRCSARGSTRSCAARRIGRARYDVLADKISETLEAAIRAGGSTLRDFVGGDGRAGYFQDEHLVYGRAGEPCGVCGTFDQRIAAGAAIDVLLRRRVSGGEDRSTGDWFSGLARLQPQILLMELLFRLHDCPGQTGCSPPDTRCWHCGSSKWPTHSVHFAGSIT